jgi:hypothetical protein
MVEYYVTYQPSNPSSILGDEDEEVGDYEEGISAYIVGDFHPVSPGESYKEGRYQIIRKLGFGSTSTVWLSVDRRLPQSGLARLIAVMELVSPLNSSKRVPVLASWKTFSGFIRSHQNTLDINICLGSWIISNTKDLMGHIAVLFSKFSPIL